eukprot:UN0807
MASKPHVLVNIISARHLPEHKECGWLAGKAASSSPYCTCEIVGKHNSKFQTMAANEGELNPTWNRHDYVEDYEVGDPLHFEVRHQGKKGEGALLGQVTICSDMFQPNGFEGELRLAGVGEAFLTIKVTPTYGMHAGAEGEAAELFDKIDKNHAGLLTRDDIHRAVAAGLILP